MQSCGSVAGRKPWTISVILSKTSAGHPSGRLFQLTRKAKSSRSKRTTSLNWSSDSSATWSTLMTWRQGGPRSRSNQMSRLHLIDQPSKTGVHAYGVFRHGRVGGALLYGPPGTGETHLARVLARESKAITICASVADIENKYVGETEKAIKGLFSLGRMLSPCTIFIDEADALFRSRKSDDRGWERSQLNQLLYETDGLKKPKIPPFVLLATNFPRELDHAVLRRVPSRIHIDLPSPEARQKFFQICLADEKLHSEVDFHHLVEKSREYSGSDIQTVCVQAALICDTVVSDDDTRRLLKPWNFEMAFRRSAPTVSKTALAGIKTFAKEFDVAALDYMGHEEELGSMHRKAWCLRCEDCKNMRGRDYQPQKQGTTPWH